MKKSLILFSLAGLLLGSHAVATEMRAQKLCFVNFEAAISLEVEAKKYLEGLEIAEMDINKDEQKAREDIEKKMTNFRSSMAGLSEKARQEKEAQLTAEISKLQQQFTQRRMEQNQKRQEISRQLEDKNRLLLDSISKNSGCDVVFNAAALVYVSDEIKKNDLTQKLVDSYNKAYPVKGETKAGPAAKTPTKTPAKPVKK